MEKDVGMLSIFFVVSIPLSFFFSAREEKADKGDNAVEEA